MDLGYVIIYVEDVAATVAFYHQAFSLPTRFIHEGGDYAELETGKTVLAFASIGLAETNFPGGCQPLTQMERPAGMEIALVTTELTATIAAAVQAGAKVLSPPATKPWGQTVAFLRAPEGTLIELCTPVSLAPAEVDAADSGTSAGDDNPDNPFPHLNNINFLGYCSVSPLNRPAAERSYQFNQRQLEIGRGVIFEYSGERNIGQRFRNAFGQWLKTDSQNITMGTNTSEMLCMIANGYPFQPGDQIISYVHEYPANHYPWIMQCQRRQVELILLTDSGIDSNLASPPVAGSVVSTAPKSNPSPPLGWSMEELESRITDRTRVIAISHVQFTSGFAADLMRLGELCRQHQIDLVVDAAQSLGCLPIYPEAMNISCLAAAGWKWLMGPIGTGVMYTSPEFRNKIEITMAGADLMLQDTEYLNHQWNPHQTGKKFEYSTMSYALLDGLSAGVEEIFLKTTPEFIRDSIFRLQDQAITALDPQKFQPIVHPTQHRSGILSLVPLRKPAASISAELESAGIVITPRDGYLRFAPHFFTPESFISNAVEALNRFG